MRIIQIPEYQSDSIKKVITDLSFPWYYNPGTLFDNSFRDKHQWVHTLVRDGKIGSNYSESIFNIIRPFIPEFETHFLYRSKINCNTPYKRRESILPHIDDHTSKGSVSYIYYVHDSDGPTRIYENWWRTIKVNPKQGRLLRFTSDTRHSGNIPYKFETRTVINFVFFSKPDID